MLPICDFPFKLPIFALRELLVLLLAIFALFVRNSYKFECGMGWVVWFARCERIRSNWRLNSLDLLINNPLSLNLFKCRKGLIFKRIIQISFIYHLLLLLLLISYWWHRSISLFLHFDVFDELFTLFFSNKILATPKVCRVNSLIHICVLGRIPPNRFPLRLVIHYLGSSLSRHSLPQKRLLLLSVEKVNLLLNVIKGVSALRIHHRALFTPTFAPHFKFGECV